jgi:hypothetical protein
MVGSSAVRAVAVAVAVAAAALCGSRVAAAPQASTWIASVVDGPEACDKVRVAALGLWAARSPDARVARAGGDEGSNAHTILDLCWVVFQGDAEVAEQVRGLDGVVAVEADAISYPDAARPFEAGYGVPYTAPYSWGLDRIDQAALPLDRASFSPAFTGRDQVVYMVDTGVQADHLDFAGTYKWGRRIIVGPDFINATELGADLNGHGSHTTGTAIGTAFGVAKDATAVSVRTCGPNGCPTSSVLGAFEWIVDHFAATAPPGTSAVVSYSIGGGNSYVMDQAAQAVSDAGLIFVGSAGNDNFDACMKSPARVGGTARSSFGLVIVGSTAMLDGMADVRSSFSNFGPCVDIYAPGTEIRSAWYGSPVAVNTVSGTSMATPLVSGTLLTLLEKHRGNKTAAMTELFDVALPNMIQDANPKTLEPARTNLLLQLPTGSRADARAPPAGLYSPPQLCLNGTCLHIGTNYGSFTGSMGWPLNPETLNYSVSAPLVELYDFDKSSIALNGSACIPLAHLYTGRVVLVERGICSFNVKVTNAAAAGAVGVIIVNLAGPPFDFSLAPLSVSTAPQVPVIMISGRHDPFFRNNLGKIVQWGHPDIPAPAVVQDSRVFPFPAPVLTSTPSATTRMPTVTARPSVAPTSPTQRPTFAAAFCVKGKCYAYRPLQMQPLPADTLLFGPLVTASENPGLCNTPALVNNYTGKFLFLSYADYTASMCEYYDSAIMAQAAGALGLVVGSLADTLSPGYPAGVPVGKSYTILVLTTFPVHEASITADLLETAAFGVGAQNVPLDTRSPTTPQMSKAPTNGPTVKPTLQPSTARPTLPTPSPTGRPTSQPTSPTVAPSKAPTSASPSSQPTGAPTGAPTSAAGELPMAAVIGGAVGGGLFVLAGLLGAAYIVRRRPTKTADLDLAAPQRA